MDLQSVHPDNAELANLAQSYLSWPRRFGAFKSLEALEAHYAVVLKASEIADNLRLVLANMSGQADAGVRPYIQDTTEDLFVICNAGMSESSSVRSEARANSRSLAKPEALTGRESKRETSSGDHNSKFMENLSPQRLFWLSSEEMQFYITHHQGQRAAPTAMDFVLASIDRLGELGINRSAYIAAQEQMGDMATALCILIIDRNRFHPQTPIRNPGGVLRSMTTRHAAGVLNIVGSLIGLSERGRVAE
jgi:replication initiation protein RepC